MQRPYKTPEEYSKSIKILKYYIEQTMKENEFLKIQKRRFDREKNKRKKKKEVNIQAFKADTAIKDIYSTLKRKGIALEGLFRMADTNYNNEILNEEIVRTLGKLKVNISETEIMQLANTIDTSGNGKVSYDEFQEFIHTYGVGNDPEKTINLQTEAFRKFTSHLRSHTKTSAQELFDKIDKDSSQIIDTQELFNYCKQNSVMLNHNQIFSVMRCMDPGKQGIITKQKFVQAILTINKKQVVDSSNQKFEIEMKVFKAKLVKNKVNPFEVFDQADLDRNGEATKDELIKVLKKYLPNQSRQYIESVIDLVNYNKYKIIERSQFLSIVTHFYKPEQLEKMKQESESKIETKLTYHSTQKLLAAFNDKIEDMQKTRKEVFQILDTDGSQAISSKQFTEGLKKQFALDSPFVINLLNIFDEDKSGTISMKQFLKILGDDVSFSQIQLQDDRDNAMFNKKKVLLNKNQAKTQSIKKPTKEPIKKKKQQTKVQSTQNKKQTSKTKQPVVVNKSKQQPVKKAVEKNVINKAPSKDKQFETKKSIQQIEKSKSPVKKVQNKVSNTSSLIASKVTKKQSKTQKEQEVKKIPVVKKPSQNIKADKEVKKQTKKKQPQPQPQPQPTPKQQQQPINQLQNNDQQQKSQVSDQELEIHFKRLSGLYKLNEQKILKQFGQYDKKNGYVTKQGFTKSLQLLLSIKDSLQKERIINALFERANVNDMIVFYADWLKQVAQEHQPLIINDKAWKKQIEKPAKTVIKEVEKIEIIQPQIEITQQPLVGPKLQADDLDIISNNSIKKDPSNKKRRSTIKSIKDNDQKEILEQEVHYDKRGDNLTDIFLSNQIFAIIVNGPNKGRSSNLLSHTEHDENKLKQFYKKTQKIKNQNNKFIDTNFGHNLQSLIKSQNDYVKNNKKDQIKQYKKYAWTHVNDIWTTPLAFKSSVGPQDIRQGSLGDCYFLSSLACLAEYNLLIQRLFQYQDQNNSFFGVWLCLDGTWTLVELDGYIVTNKQQNGKLEPIFSRSGTPQQFWVILLEKAYAKVYGSYNQIQSGHPVEAIRDLTGAPGKMYRHIITTYPVEQLWQILVQANINQFMMTAGTDGRRKGRIKQGKQQQITDQNIVLGHAYSILDLKQLNTGEKLIQMRNPWGGTQWNGAWGDKDKRWTPQLKKLLNYVDQQDGIFWMPFQTYYKQFQETTINFIRPSYFYKSKINNGNLTQFIVVVQPFIHGYLTVSQKDQRHQVNPKNKQSYKLIQLQGLALNSKNKYRRLKQQSSPGLRDNCAEFNLEEDQKLYLLVDLGSALWCNISYYGKKDINFQIEKIDTYLDNILLNIDVDPNDEQKSQEMILSSGTFSTYFFIRATNISKQKRTFKLTYIINGLQNLKILSPYTNSMQCEVTLKPGKTELIKYKAINTYEGFGLGFSTKIQVL